MGLLRRMGYQRVRHWQGGLEAWKERGLALEAAPRPRPAARPAARMGLLGWVSATRFSTLLLAWVGLILAFGLAYWACEAAGRALLELGQPVAPGLHGLLTALYFSFVTATSVGFGDVTPVGPVRALAIGEAILALLLFGVVVSKMVTRRQDALIEEIHRTTFELKLGRVRTNLHLVLSELQSLAAACAEPRLPVERLLPRVEGAVLVLLGELRAVHDLLYRPQESPSEDVLESLLAGMTSALAELAELLACGQHARSSPVLVSACRSIVGMAGEICGECVPREHAPHLKAWMDRVQALSRRVEAALPR